MGSKRLPGKVLKPLAGVPVIKQIYDRASMIAGLSKVVVATSDSARDDVLVDYCISQEIPILRGSEDDVLDRYVQAARQLNANVVMRITGDCPFIDPKVSESVLDLLLANPDCEYASNVTIRSYPDGLDTEVVRSSALERLWETVSDSSYREHVTQYITTHLDEFHTLVVKSPVDYSAHRWTLDRTDDYEMLSAVADELQVRQQFGYYEEILRILKEHPEIAEINAQHLQEGILK
jgi:spore coat polysaccharide biosynthesis protein SpsF (cytidylyltransferase family)